MSWGWQCVRLALTDDEPRFIITRQRDNMQSIPDKLYGKDMD